MIVPFSKPTRVPQSEKYLLEAIQNDKLCGGGPFTKKAEDFLKNHFGGKGEVFLTPSATSALEMAVLLTNVAPGDEFIVPSYTFTSTASAVALFGATPVFVDVDPSTLNINIDAIEAAITPKTKAIMPMHYAGVSCDMEKISRLAKKHNLFLIEDAAQALGSSFEGKPVGVYSDFSAFSFHETKNITTGEGGALLVNNPHMIERAEIVREKGTNRRLFLRGEADKYTWVDKGSSYTMSEFQAAYLLGQLEMLDTITKKRQEIWTRYHQALLSYEEKGYLKRPSLKEGTLHNAHIYYLIFPSHEKAEALRSYLKENGVTAPGHYVALHHSEAGKAYGRSVGNMSVSSDLPPRLIRLPVYYNMTEEEQTYVLDLIKAFFKN